MTGIYAENGPSPAPAADRGGTGVPEGRPRGTVVPRGWLPKIPPYGHLRVTPTANADSYHLRRTSLKTMGIPHGSPHKDRSAPPVPRPATRWSRRRAGRDPADQQRRAGTRIGPAAADQPACGPAGQAGGGGNVAAEAGPETHAPQP